MKLLFFTQNLPYPTDAGDRLRTRNLIEILNTNHTVHCLFFPKGRRDIKDIPAFQAICPSDLKYTIIRSTKKRLLNRAYNYFTDPILQRKQVLIRLKSLLADFRPDVVWMDYLFIGQYISVIKSQKIPVIYGTHNSQSDLTRQLVQSKSTFIPGLPLRLMTFLHHWHEKAFFNQADRLVCVSNRDKNFHQAFVSPEQIVIIPNFVSLARYDNVVPIKHKFAYICFIGSLDNIQNEKGIKCFVSQIWDIIAARVENIYLFIIGRGAKEDYELQQLIASRSNIEVYDNVPSVIPFLKGALVSVVPLLHGSGTRLKIIESMACRKPIVSTTIGAEGLGAKDGRDIFIADEPKDFAEKTVKLIHDEKLRNKMGESAYRFVKEKFGFEAVGNIIHQMIASVVAE